MQNIPIWMQFIGIFEFIFEYIELKFICNKLYSLFWMQLVRKIELSYWLYRPNIPKEYAQFSTFHAIYGCIRVHVWIYWTKIYMWYVILTVLNAISEENRVHLLLILTYYTQRICTISHFECNLWVYLSSFLNIWTKIQM